METYAKKSLTAFKDKFVQTFQAVKNEKLLQDEKIKLLQEKLQANQETARREERLLLSSMYELGMKIMDRTYQNQMLEASPASRISFL